MTTTQISRTTAFVKRHAFGILALIVVSAGPAHAAVARISGAQIKSGTVTSQNIKNNNLAGIDIKDGSLTSADIQPGSLPGSTLAPSAVGSTQIADHSVAPADLAHVPSAALTGGGQTIPGASPATVALQDIDWDTDSMTDNIAHTITVPLDGNYFVAGDLQWGGGGSGSREATVIVNGETMLTASEQATNAGPLQHTDGILRLHAGDVLKLSAYNGSIDAQDTLGYTSALTHVLAPRLTVQYVGG